MLQVQQRELPPLSDHQIAIDVRASGVNFADILIRQGLYPGAPPLPAVIGYEAAGTVADIGNGVLEFEPGQRVVAMVDRGGYSDRLHVNASQVVELADEVSFEAAAATPVNYVTAWLMLAYLGNLHAEETVLVHAAAGGVGQAAVQICRWHGATVIGTASLGKHERLLETGVAHCIDYRSEDFGRRVLELTDGRGVDIVLDGIGGASFRTSYECLAPLGRLFMYGVSAMVPGRRRNLWAVARHWLRLPRFRPLDLLSDNRGVFGISLGYLKHKERLRIEILRRVMDLVAQGELSPVIDRCFSFAEAADAQQWLHDRKNFGKVLLVP